MSRRPSHKAKRLMRQRGLCPRCGRSAGSHARRTLRTRYRPQWDGSLVKEQVCSRCGYTDKTRTIEFPPMLPRWGLISPRLGLTQYGHHLSGVRGGIGTYAGYRSKGTARDPARPEGTL